MKSWAMPSGLIETQPNAESENQNLHEAAQEKDTGPLSRQPVPQCTEEFVRSPYQHSTLRVARQAAMEIEQPHALRLRQLACFRP
jgi:hypothetical protein